MSNILSADDFDDAASTVEPTLPGIVEPAPSTIPPQIRFKAARDRLMELERDLLQGKTIDLKEVQALTNEVAALLHEIQVTTTGPRKKAETINGEEKKPKAPKAKKATSSFIMPADDF